MIYNIRKLSTFKKLSTLTAFHEICQRTIFLKNNPYLCQPNCFKNPGCGHQPSTVNHQLLIQKLSIRNYAIIEALEISFPEGLTIITGETGAGKSILLGALNLIMGGRADSKSLHDDTQKCVIEGVFEVDKYRLQSFFR